MKHATMNIIETSALFLQNNICKMDDFAFAKENYFAFANCKKQDVNMNNADTSECRFSSLNIIQVSK